MTLMRQGRILLAIVLIAAPVCAGIALWMRQTHYYQHTALFTGYIAEGRFYLCGSDIGRPFSITEKTAGYRTFKDIIENSQLTYLVGRAAAEANTVFFTEIIHSKRGMMASCKLTHTMRHLWSAHRNYN